MRKIAFITLVVAFAARSALAEEQGISNLPDGNGSVVFVNSSGDLAEDATNLIWDDTYNRLGIGTNSPSYQLTVKSASISNNPLVVGASDGASDLLRISENSGGNCQVSLYDTSGNEDIKFRTDNDSWFNGGNLGIGTTAPVSALHVANGAYAQFENNGAGAPAGADCNADNKRGRLYIDTTNNRLFICNGATRAWDYVNLID